MDDGKPSPSPQTTLGRKRQRHALPPAALQRGKNAFYDDQRTNQPDERIGSVFHRRLLILAPAVGFPNLNNLPQAGRDTKPRSTSFPPATAAPPSVSPSMQLNRTKCALNSVLRMPPATPTLPNPPCSWQVWMAFSTASIPPRKVLARSTRMSSAGRRKNAPPLRACPPRLVRLPVLWLLTIIPAPGRDLQPRNDRAVGQGQDCRGIPASASPAPLRTSAVFRHLFLIKSTKDCRQTQWQSLFFIMMSLIPSQRYSFQNTDKGKTSSGG